MPVKHTPGLKFRSENVSIIECKPCVRTINYCHDRYKVSLPYTIFVVSHARIHGMFAPSAYHQIFFRFQPLISRDDYLHETWMPNVSDAGTICLFQQGEDFEEFTQRHYKYLHEICEDVIGLFWGSNFNADMPFQMEQYDMEMAYWEKESKNPAWALTVPTSRVCEVERHCRGDSWFDILE